MRTFVLVHPPIWVPGEGGGNPSGVEEGGRDVQVEVGRVPGEEELREEGGGQGVADAAANFKINVYPWV